MPKDFGLKKSSQLCLCFFSQVFEIWLRKNCPSSSSPPLYRLGLVGVHLAKYISRVLKECFVCRYRTAQRALFHHRMTRKYSTSSRPQAPQPHPYQNPKIPPRSSPSPSPSPSPNPHRQNLSIKTLSPPPPVNTEQLPTRSVKYPRETVAVYAKPLASERKIQRRRSRLWGLGYGSCMRHTIETGGKACWGEMGVKRFD
ncbi:hypothetical protein BDR22DRAFT_225059 [Usnea florida]